MNCVSGNVKVLICRGVWSELAETIFTRWTYGWYLCNEFSFIFKRETYITRTKYYLALFFAILSQKRQEILTNSFADLGRSVFPVGEFQFSERDGLLHPLRAGRHRGEVYEHVTLLRAVFARAPFLPVRVQEAPTEREKSERVPPQIISLASYATNSCVLGVVL